MKIFLKNIIFNTAFNLILFLLLMIGIQNSTNKTKINLIINESVNLPISFIVGMSFISGSLTGGILFSNLNNRNKENL